MKFQVGEKVRLVNTGEIGVVVHTWDNEEMDSQDNYIAFFGPSYPIGKPKEKPYVLRYLSSSLEKVE